MYCLFFISLCLNFYSFSVRSHSATIVIFLFIDLFIFMYLFIHLFIYVPNFWFSSSISIYFHLYFHYYFYFYLHFHYYFIFISILIYFFILYSSFFFKFSKAMENMNKPETLQIITSRILQNLKNLQGRYTFLLVLTLYFSFLLFCIT